MKILKERGMNILIGFVIISCILCSEFIVETSKSTEDGENGFSINKHEITEQELIELKSYLGTYDENETYIMSSGNYSTGLIPPTKEEWNFFSKNALIVDNVSIGNKTLPSSYDISDQEEYFPPIGDQVNGSCVTWSLVYYMMTYQIARNFSWDLTGSDWDNECPDEDFQDHIFSPYFVYNHLNEGIDQGVSHFYVIKFLNETGICTWNNFCFDNSNPYNLTMWPDEIAYRQAPIYRAKNKIHTLFLNSNEKIIDLKKLIYNNTVSSFGMKCDVILHAHNGVVTNDSYEYNSGSGHCVTIVGYDDNKTYDEDGDDREGAFKIANSWGDYPSGDNGFFWMSYGAMLTYVGECFWFYIDEGYQPNLIAVVNLSHDYRGECDVSLCLDDVNNPTDEKMFNFSGGDYEFPSNPFVIDITNFNKSITTPHGHDYFITVYDKNQTGQTGSINSINIEYYDEYDESGQSYNTSASNYNVVNTANGKMVNSSVLLSIFENDMGAYSLNYPKGGNKYKTGSYAVNISARNYGSNEVAICNVTCNIYKEIEDKWELNWNETKSISNISSAEKKYMEFSLWDVSEEGNYSINISTDLSNDEYHYNDYLNYTIWITNINDSGVVSIDYPAGNQEMGTYDIGFTIKNYGTWDLTNVTFNCSVYRDEGAVQNLSYSNETVLSLFSALEERNLIFSNWTINQYGWYTINISTQFEYGSDDNESNNYMISYIRVPAPIVYVDDDYTNNTPEWNVEYFSSIQDGIDAVEEFGIVNVYDGIYIENITLNSTIDLYGNNTVNTIIDGGGNGTIVSLNAENINISGFTIRNSGQSATEKFAGIFVGGSFTEKANIFNNIFYNNSIGVNIHKSCFSEEGISTYCNVISNIFQENINGLRLEAVNNNLVMFNTFLNSTNSGINLSRSHGNNLSYNNFQENNNGIYLNSSCFENLFHHNNFYNSTSSHACDLGSNSWNSYSAGNYWDNYTGDDSDEDGIGDIPYDIQGGDNQDNYPLMQPWIINNITKLDNNWNFISIPFNESISKINISVRKNLLIYNWSEAINKNFINNFVFGWNQINQCYTFTDIFYPGFGYWIFAYNDNCELIPEKSYSINSDNYITDLNSGWNIIGLPYSQTVNKTNLLVDGVNWEDAVLNGSVSDYIFGWNRLGQYYEFSDVLAPGEAYWLYASQNCSIRKNNGSGNNDGVTNKKSWEMTLSIESNLSNVTNSLVVFGESVDATEGLQNDFYEAPRPPAMADGSYLSIWSDNDLTSPYHQLSKDFRTWPDTNKTWNLTVSYISDTDSNTSVNLSWNKTFFIESEYNTISLYDNSTNSTVNMLTQAYYQFNMTVNSSIDFQVLCSNGTLPVFENVTASPSTGGFGENITISADVYHLFNNISTVKVNVTNPDNSTNNYTMTNTFNNTYQYGFDDTWQIGTYQYYLWATDTQGNSSYTKQYDFSIIANASIQVCTINNTYTSADDINVTDPPTPSTLYDIGYELLDDGDVLHMWNLYDSYYFDTDSGIQLTNHKDEYWSHNVLMLGYYNNDNWNLIYRTDELSGFQKTVDTDNQTFVNVTLWKDLTYQGYEFRLAIRYHLGLEDNELTVIPYIKNLGDPIPYTLGFAWEINDIRIDDTPENDYILINDSYYWLNESLNLSFTNLSKPVYCWNETMNEYIVCGYEPIPYFHIQENISSSTVRSLYLRWNPDVNYKVWIQSQNDSYNAPVVLGIQIGTLDSGESKQTSLYWYDADQQVFYYDTNSPFETWTSNPGYMVDNNTGTFATTSIENDVEKLTGNSCPEIDPGKISKVEIRAYAKYSGYACSLLLRPVFKYGDGDNHEYELTQTASWSDWYDITEDLNAPDWTWKDIETFDCDVEAYDFNILFSSTVYCAKVEIRVTYSPWTPPSITNPTPAYGSTNVSIQPMLSIDVSDDDGDELDISWLSNCSGSWQEFATNNSVGNGTYYQTMNGAYVNGQWWYWRLNVSDDHDYNLSSVFKFHTGTQSKLVNTGTTTIKGYLLMQAEFWNGSAWIADQVVIDDTSPRYLNASGVLGLDTVFNGLLDTGDLHYGDGDYRVYAALCNPYGEVLEIDSEKLDTWWTFEVDLV